VPRVAGHGVGCAVATSFARVWVARGRARAGRNSGWEMPREGCREDVCGCGCENPRGVAGVGHAARRSTLSVHIGNGPLFALLVWRGIGFQDAPDEKPKRETARRPGRF